MLVRACVCVCIVCVSACVHVSVCLSVFVYMSVYDYHPQSHNPLKLLEWLRIDCSECSAVITTFIHYVVEQAVKLKQLCMKTILVFPGLFNGF